MPTWCDASTFSASNGFDEAMTFRYRVAGWPVVSSITSREIRVAPAFTVVHGFANPLEPRVQLKPFDSVA